MPEPLTQQSLKNKQFALAKYLMNKQINFATDKINEYVIMAMRDQADVSIIEYLLNSGADLNFKDQFKRDFLDFAAEIHVRVFPTFEVKRLDNTTKNYRIEDPAVLKMLLKHYIAHYKAAPVSDNFTEDLMHKLQLMKLALMVDDIYIIHYLFNPGKKGMSVNADATVSSGEQGHRPLLSIALSYGCKITTVQFLVEQGADVNRADEMEYSPLHWAIATKNRAAVELLLKRGADINYNHPDSGPLIIDAITQDPSLAALLIDSGVNLQVQSPRGASPLMVAAESGSLALVKKILESDPKSLNYTDPNHTSALLVCFHKEEKNLAIIYYLLQQGADPNTTSAEFAFPPLFYAFLDKDLVLVKKLIAHGATMSFKMMGVRDLLINAIKNEQLELLEALLSTPEMMNAQDDQGNTPLMLAVKLEKPNVTGMLLTKGADATLKNAKGQDALSMAVDPVFKVLEDYINKNKSHRKQPLLHHYPTQSKNEAEEAIERKDKDEKSKLVPPIRT